MGWGAGAGGRRAEGRACEGVRGRLDWAGEQGAGFRQVPGAERLRSEKKGSVAVGILPCLHLPPPRSQRLSLRRSAVRTRHGPVPRQTSNGAWVLGIKHGAGTRCAVYQESTLFHTVAHRLW